MFFPTYFTSNSYLNRETPSKHLIIDIMKKQIFFFRDPRIAFGRAAVLEHAPGKGL